MMKSLIKISSMLLIVGFVFADGVYDSYDIPSFEYQTLQITGYDLLNFESQGDNSEMSVDLGAKYNFISQSPGFNYSYGGSFSFDMYDDGLSEEEGSMSSTDFFINGTGSGEKYFTENNGVFGYGDADFMMYGGDQADTDGPYEDDNMDLILDIGAGYGRIVNARPVAQAYAIADALGDTSDETVAAIAAVIGAESSYASIHKDDATEMFFNDIAAAAGDPTAAMKVMKIFSSPAYNISDRYTGYSVRAGLVNNYMQGDYTDYDGIDLDDNAGYFSLQADYAMPIGMDKQVTAGFTYAMQMNDDDWINPAFFEDYDYYSYEEPELSHGLILDVVGGSAYMGLGATFSMDHSYNWSSGASFDYGSTTYGDEVESVFTTTTLGVSTTKAILNQCSVKGAFSYQMQSLTYDGETSDDVDDDPVMSIDVTLTYWVF